MNLPSRSFSDLVRDMSAAITASFGDLIDMSVGSVLRAIIEANAAIGLWAQWLIALTLQTTRAATSAGIDLDTWMADFSFFRLPAQAASGTISFSRYSGGVIAQVPAGSLVKTNDGSVVFRVMEDVENSAWQASLGTYVLATGILSLDLPVESIVPGLIGNVGANSITLLASPIAGVDFVNNNGPIFGGADAESDDFFRYRFTAYMASLSRATIDAVRYAITTVGSDLKYILLENTDAGFQFRPGSLLIICSDPFGNLPSTIFNALTVALNATRGVGTVFFIVPPSIISINVSMTVTWVGEPVPKNAAALITIAVSSYLGGIAIGGLVSLSRIIETVYATTPGISNISNITINSANVDLQLEADFVAIFGSVTLR